MAKSGTPTALQLRIELIHTALYLGCTSGLVLLTYVSTILDPRAGLVAALISAVALHPALVWCDGVSRRLQSKN